MWAQMGTLAQAGLTFRGRQMRRAAHEAASLAPALAWLVLYIALEAVVAYFRGNSGDSGLARMGLQGLAAALAQAGSMAIGTFGSAWVMQGVLRLFKARVPYRGLLVVYAAAVVWSVLGTLVGLLLPSAVWVGVLFWLLYNLALLVGLRAYAQVRLWQAFAAIVVTFLLIFVVMLGYGALVQALLA